MTFFWVVLIVIVVWWLARHSTRPQQMVVAKSDEGGSEAVEITEEAVFKAQNEFEEHIEQTYLPDALSGREIYIYRRLMRVWYNKLSSENRYNEKMTQKLRNDWLDYMSALGDRSTYNYLSLELDDEEKQKHYREEHALASRKAFAIEEAFAAAIGKEAVDELARIRSTDTWGLFSRDGEMAPEGFTYDLHDSLVPIKKPA